ncbi:MAG TPA: hypothetical protein VEW91_12330, partial [bacterium]|nr:hypothetical protein [bacterium]
MYPRDDAPGSGRRGRFVSLQARITLSVGVAVAVILVAFGYSATWAIRESTSTVLQDRVQIAEVLAGQIATRLTGDRDTLEDLARTLSQDPDRRREEAVLQQVAESRRFSGLALGKPGGRLLWLPPALWPTPSIPALSPVLRAAPQAGRPDP